MPSDSDRVVTGYKPGSPRQRAISTVLSAGVVLLVLLAAIYQTQIVPHLEEKRKNPVTFDVAGTQADSGNKADEKQPEKQEPRKARQEPVEVAKVTPPVEQPVEKKKPAFTFLKLSSADFAASDIGAMTRSDSDDAAGGNSGRTYGPGEGPGGAILYNADWYREPTDAQLGGYLPANAPREGWGMIACQTLDHYRVDNCQILGESPRGSGFGRAVLDAAWQFQVIPPRINGKPQLGEWVRIRIEYGSRKAAG